MGAAMRKTPFKRKAAAAIVLAAVAAAPWTWLPAIGSIAVRHWLDLKTPGSATARFTHLSPFGLKAENVSAGSVPGAPRAAFLEARYTPAGLLKGKIRSFSASGLAWDAPTSMPEQVSAFFPSNGATGRLSLVWREGLGYRGAFTADLLGAPLKVDIASDPDIREFTATALLRPAAAPAKALPQVSAKAVARRHDVPKGETYAFLVAEAEIRVDGIDAAISAAAEVSSEGFCASATLPQSRFSRSDALLGPILGDTLPPSAQGIDFSGSLEAGFSAEKRTDDALARWEASVRIRDFSLAAPVGENEARVEGGGAFFRAEGLGAHVDPRPFGLKFGKASFDRFELGPGSMWFRADRDSVLLTEGFAGFCGGTVRVYALHMNLASLDSGFTMTLDDLDASQVISLFPQIRGTATGKLHGKLPLSVRNGSEIRLRNAYLYSPPGQIGKLKLESAPVLVDRLRATGLPDETCDALEKALEDLDYDILRFDLAQDPKTGEGRLAMRLHGSAAASSGRAATPVDLNITFNGQLEEALNTGIKAAGIKAGVGKR